MSESTSAWLLNHSLGLQHAGWLFLILLIGCALFVYLVRRQEWVISWVWPRFDLSALKPIKRWFWLIIILLLATVVRVAFLNQPMRGDEAYTFLQFVNGGFTDLFNYPAPNNHVLNTLLFKAVVSVFGASPATIRLPVLLAGLIGIVVIYQLAKDFSGRDESGFLAALMFATLPYFILYSTNARGYTLLVLLSMILIQLCLRLVNNFSGGNAYLFYVPP